ILPMLFVSCGHQHKYLKDVNEPTCTEEGFTLYLCEECGDFYEDNKKKPLGHDLEHHEGKAATCEEAGYEAYDTCKRCSYSTYKSIPALDHAYGQATYSWNQDNTKVTATILCDRNQTHIISETVDVTKSIETAKCLETGLITYSAQFKNKAFTTQIKEEEIKAIGHDIQTESAKAPTCKEVGYEAYEYCSRCDYSTKKEIPALGHSYDSNEICTRCGDLAAWEYLTYEYDNELEGYAVTGVAKERTTIHIPETYMDNKPVVKIKTNAFANQTMIQEINIPTSIETIESKAFLNCTGLTELSIPFTVKNVEKRILDGCSGITKLSLPNTLKSAPHLADYFSLNAFADSYDTKEGFVPLALKEVSLYGGYIVGTFSSCKYLETIHLNHVSYIGYQYATKTVFKDCINLQELWLDSTLEGVSGGTGLDTCPNLKQIYYKGNENDWAKINFASSKYKFADCAEHIYFVDEENNANLVTKIDITNPEIQKLNLAQFAGFKDVVEINLSSSIQEISSTAFNDCISLQKIVLPESLTKIGSGAFAGCYSVKSVEINNNYSNNEPLLRVLFGEFSYDNSYKIGPTNNLQIAYVPVALEKIILNGNWTLFTRELRNMIHLKEIYIPNCTT
ncbi:MAG: leucine-rich repeat domain-containing protein, partial [Anaeroplasmataceae bacterium]|nr:leucine-rich repeat domain-containing protein [Anaeroplasmataceae bacterium]